MRVPIAYEDKNFVVIDKPAGIAVHGGAGIQEATIADWLVRHYPEVASVGDEPSVRPGIVHRLDKGTSGVMIAARNQETFEGLKQLFKNRLVAKTYLALVRGAPKKNGGMIEAPIGRSLRNPTKRSADPSSRGSRSAITRWRILERFRGFALIVAEPKTGRMHQIRVHLAHLGHPIAGDRTYGPKSKPEEVLEKAFTRPFLHAWRLAFSYPPGHGWQFEAALPDDLQAILADLRTLRTQK